MDGFRARKIGDGNGIGVVPERKEGVKEYSDMSKSRGITIKELLLQKPWTI